MTGIKKKNTTKQHLKLTFQSSQVTKEDHSSDFPEEILIYSLHLEHFMSGYSEEVLTLCVDLMTTGKQVFICCSASAQQSTHGLLEIKLLL